MKKWLFTNYKGENVSPSLNVVAGLVLILMLVGML